MSSFLSWLIETFAPAIKHRQHIRRHIGVVIVLVVIMVIPLAIISTWMFLHHQMFYEHYIRLAIALIIMGAYAMLTIIGAVFYLVSEWLKDLEEGNPW